MSLIATLFVIILVYSQYTSWLRSTNHSGYWNN